MTWSLDLQKRATALFKNGASCSKVAKALGLNRGSVCWARVRYGLGRPPGVVDRRPRKPPRDVWTAERLTERWADRKRA